MERHRSFRPRRCWFPNWPEPPLPSRRFGGRGTCGRPPCCLQCWIVGTGRAAVDVVAPHRSSATFAGLRRRVGPRAVGDGVAVPAELPRVRYLPPAAARLRPGRPGHRSTFMPLATMPDAAVARGRQLRADTTGSPIRSGYQPSPTHPDAPRSRRLRPTAPVCSGLDDALASGDLAVLTRLPSHRCLGGWHCGSAARRRRSQTAIGQGVLLRSATRRGISPVFGSRETVGDYRTDGRWQVPVGA